MYRVYELTEEEQGKIYRRRWDGDTYYWDVYESPEELEEDSERLRRIAEEAEKRKAEYLEYLKVEEMEKKEEHKMFNADVKEGYTMLALVSDGSIYHAIIDRHTEVDRWVYCFAYDVEDGSWGNGVYCNSYSSACKRLAEHLG